MQALLSADKMNYEKLVRVLEAGWERNNFEHVNYSKLRSRYHRIKKNFQEYDKDVERKWPKHPIEETEHLIYIYMKSHDQKDIQEKERGLMLRISGDNWSSRIMCRKKKMKLPS